MTSLANPFLDPGLVRARVAGVTVATILVAGASAALLTPVAGSGPDLVVLAVMLSISFTRERAGATLRQRILGAVALPLVGVAAGIVGAIMTAAPPVGDALYVLVVSGAIWLRRFGPVATRLGTLIALPFVTVLVVPLPVRPSGFFAGWAALVALLVVALVLLAAVIGHRTGFLPEREASRDPRPPAREPAATTPRNPGSSRKLRASTRMAVQMAVALTAAFVIGHLLFGEHWPWLVLTAYLVSSGNRGRGDVLYKGVLRVLGALAGTVVGTVVALNGQTGDPVLIVAIGVIVALALWLRPVGYGWWAAGVTAALALLYDYTGTASDGVLILRLVAIVVGGVIASLSATLVLPVRTVDVVRRRTADALAAVSAWFRAAGDEAVRGDQGAVEAVAERRRDLDRAVVRLAQVAPVLRAHRVALRRGTGDEHPAALVDLIEQSIEPGERLVAAVMAGRPGARRSLGAAARRLGGVRRVLWGADPVAAADSGPGGEDDDAAADEPLATLLDLCDRLDAAILELRRVRI